MGRAYLRVDPGLFDRKLEQGYPPPAIGTFLACLCLGDSQPQRGRFRDEGVLRALLTSRYSRWLPFLFERKDLVFEGKRIYIDGWDEWQEGDVTVPERMVRLRNRKRTPTVTPDDTPPVTVPRKSVEREAVATAKAESDIAGAMPDDNDPLTVICQLLNSASPIEDKKYRAKVDLETQRYGAEWVIAAYRQAMHDAVQADERPSRWDLLHSAEKHMGLMARAEELRREESEKEPPAPVRELTPDEIERQELMRKAIGVWVRGGRKGEVPTKVDDLRGWLEANGAPA